MYLPHVAAQMVTLTHPENFVGEPYKIPNFDFGTYTDLYARSIFLRGKAVT